jgi:manganese/zinc/iron transport system substrate-binding protein
MRVVLFLGILTLALGSCSQVDKKKNGRLKILATTGMIGDAVKNIVGDSADVFVLMGPGVDPHLYKPTPRDVDQLSYADVIVFNGLHLEGKMADILTKIAKRKKVIAIAEDLPKESLIVANQEMGSEGHIVYDPHIWFDVQLWNQGVKGMGKELATFDSVHQKFYLTNLDRYSKELDSLHEWNKGMIASIPKEQRVMITAHDAFHYFGKAYNIEVMGLQGISTVVEPGLKDISKLVSLISARKVKAVFVESSVSEKAIHAVIQGCQKKGHQVKVGGTLFSDAIGARNTQEGTYPGMVRYNVRTIVSGLK